MSRQFFTSSIRRIAALSGAASIGLGAVGSHKIKHQVDEYSFSCFETANRYHMIHSGMTYVAATIAPYPLISSAFFLVTV